MFQHSDQFQVQKSDDKKEAVTLRIWGQGFELTTVDPACLEAMLLLHQNNVPYKLQYSSFPFLKGIPSVTWKNIIVTHETELINFIHLICNPDVDEQRLNETTRKRIKIIKGLFVNRFVKAFTYECWLREENFRKVILPWFRDNMLFPFGDIHAKRIKKKISKQFLDWLAVSGIDDTRYIYQLHEDADNCLIQLNCILKDERPFFFGNFITSLDITVYSYLIVALKLPLWEVYLKESIVSHTHIMAFLERMHANFYPLVKEKAPSRLTRVKHTCGYYFKKPFIFMYEYYGCAILKLLLFYIMGQFFLHLKVFTDTIFDAFINVYLLIMSIFYSEE